MALDPKTTADTAADQTRQNADFAAGQAKAGAETMRDAAGRAQEAFQDRVVEPARRMGEGMKAAGESIAQNGATIGKTMIDQAERNAHEAFAAMRAAAGASDVSEVMRIQGEYLRAQGQRSMAQAKEIGELIMQFGRDAVAPMRGDRS